jgi:hypothetical protein
MLDIFKYGTLQMGELMEDRQINRGEKIKAVGFFYTTLTSDPGCGDRKGS